MTVRPWLSAALRTGLLLLLLLPVSAMGQKPEEPYSIGPEDVLQVQIFGRPDLSGPVTVGFRGDLQLPLIGNVRASAKTVDALSDELTEKYRLFDSRITEVIVTVQAYNANRVSVVGAVASPGRYGFRTIPDIWGVLLAAGGTTPLADLSEVQVVHHEPIEGESRTETVDLSDGIEKIDAGVLPTLRTRDTIVVPSADSQTRPDDRIHVLGAVRAPGLYKIAAAETVLDALALSGGPLDNARLSGVRLTRVEGGQAMTYELDVDGYLNEARPSADLSLKPGDTLTIPRKDSLMQSAINGVLRLAPLITVVTSLTVALNN